MSEPYAVVGQTFRRSPTSWLQACSYTTGELSIYGTNSSGAPSGLPNDNFLDRLNVESGLTLGRRRLVTKSVVEVG